MADELISRQAALEMAFADGEFKGLVSFWDLQILPTVDAVAVVRCKDCKHMSVELCGRYCHVWGFFNGAGDDGFCNYGERREEND